jgi:hypothetical protein
MKTCWEGGYELSTFNSQRSTFNFKSESQHFWLGYEEVLGGWRYWRRVWVDGENNRRQQMKATEGPRATVQKQLAMAVIVEFYGFEHNPWTWEQAQEAVRRQPDRRLFLRNPRELREDTEAKMMYPNMEF